MIFLFGERVRSKVRAIGDRQCAVCQSSQPFTEQLESLWFCLFDIPVLPIEQVAKYWRCEKCLNAYHPENLTLPAAAPLIRKMTAYLLLGYNQQQHAALAKEICLRISGFEITDVEYDDLVRELQIGRVDMIEVVRTHASSLNSLGKQQIIEAAFLSTYACCDLQYEDRLRINLIGNALGIGLEFVEYAISHSRKQNYYGIRRLGHVESAV